MGGRFGSPFDCEMAIPNDLVPVARVVGAYGVQGMVKLQPFATQDTVLLQLKHWWLQSPAQGAVPVPARMQRCRAHGDTIVATLAIVRTREEAQALKGHSILVSRADFPGLEEDECYWVDLIDCQVFLQQTQPPALIGTVSEVSDNGAHAVLHILQQSSGADGQLQAVCSAKGKPKYTLIPFVKAVVPVVDLSKKRLEVDWPVDF